MEIIYKTLLVLRDDAGVAGRLLQRDETFMAINSDIMQKSKAIDNWCYLAHVIRAALQILCKSHTKHFLC
jgi:short subunit dehydrogenase-like uncharacterized protein